MCDEIYKSGLYSGLGAWQAWQEGACSPEDCTVAQHRACPTGDCVGSGSRTVRCSTPWVPLQGRQMDAQLVK